MTDIDHSHTDEIVCPHCGHKNRAEHEGGNDFEDECASCEQEFRVSVDFSVHFSTSIFDREAEEAARLKRIADHSREMEADKVECAKFPPGTRVRTIEWKYGSPGMAGRTGTVANEELASFVRVNLDGRRHDDGKVDRAYRTSLDPRGLERL